MARRAAVIKPSGIAPFIIASLVRRTAVASICDSNGEQANITGHNLGMRLGACQMLGCYGSGVMPASGAGGYGSGVMQIRVAGENGIAGSPVAFSSRSFPAGSDGPSAGEWFASGWTGGNTSHQFICEILHPMDLNRGLRFHARIWRPQSGGITSLNPCVIATNSNYGQGVAGVIHPAASTPIALPTVPTNGITDFSWAISESQLVDYTNPITPLGDGGGYSFRLQRFGGADIAGEVGILYEQIEDDGQYNGIQWSKMYTKGGFPSLAPATDFCNAFTDAMIAEWFLVHAVTQVDSSRRAVPPMMLIHLLEAGNDANDAASSCVYKRGTGFGNASVSGNSAGNTKQGIKNNQQAIINRLRDVWVNVCGYDESDLYFLLGCYHPQTVNPQYTFVRTTAVDAWTEMCNENENVSCVDGYKLHTNETFAFRHPSAIYQATTPFIATSTIPLYREPATDEAHLQDLGYRHWGQTVWRAIFDSTLDQNATNPTLRMRVVSSLSGRTLIDRR